MLLSATIYQRASFSSLISSSKFFSFSSITGTLWAKLLCFATSFVRFSIFKSVTAWCFCNCVDKSRLNAICVSLFAVLTPTTDNIADVIDANAAMMATIIADLSMMMSPRCWKIGICRLNKYALTTYPADGGKSFIYLYLLLPIIIILKYYQKVKYFLIIFNIF